MKFTKMSGAGNDFIIINNIEERLTESQLRELARNLCRRKISIGADGLMAVNEASHGGDYAMLFINADGTIGEMCGNGARCIARYGHAEHAYKRCFAAVDDDVAFVPQIPGISVGIAKGQGSYDAVALSTPQIVVADAGSGFDAVEL